MRILDLGLMGISSGQVDKKIKEIIKAKAIRIDNLYQLLTMSGMVSEDKLSIRLSKVIQELLDDYDSQGSKDSR